MLAAAVMMIMAMAVPAMAAQPDDPGCFGAARAGWVQIPEFDQGAELSSRAGNNAAINLAFMANECADGQPGHGGP
jgi:hypothetical protein